MLILGNEDVEDLLTMGEIIDALEPAYRSIANGRAISGARTDVISETPYDSDARYWLKSTTGITPDLEVGTVRINSDIITWPETNGKMRRVKVPLAPGDRWCGLVLVFSTRTGEPLAIFPDGAIQRMRVAGSTALSVKHMARENAQVLGILGTGFQAGAHVMAACAVRPITKIKCYSTTLENRRAFAEAMSNQTGVGVEALDNSEDVVRGSDVVIAATNSLDPIVFAEWLEPGMHVATIRHGELDHAAIDRADVVAIHDPGNLGGGNIYAPKSLTVPDLEQEASEGAKLGHLRDAPTLAQVVAGQAGQRGSDEEITCFLNYHGLGFQFTATGAAFYRKAVASDRGHKLPTEWFTEDMHP